MSAYRLAPLTPFALDLSELRSSYVPWRICAANASEHAGNVSDGSLSLPIL